MPHISQDYWENFAAIIIAFAILALIIERALYQIFDTSVWKRIEKAVYAQTGSNDLDMKPWISVAVSLIIVYRLQLDMIAMIYKIDRPHNISLILTALFLAGGSTGIYKFFKHAREIKQAGIDNAGSAKIDPPTV